MILPNPVSPKNTLYYNGAIILRALLETKAYNFEALYQRVNKETKISYNLFILSLDWLFLLGSIKITNGNIELCIYKD